MIQTAYLNMMEKKVSDEEFDEAFERMVNAVVRKLYRDIRNNGVVREELTTQADVEQIDEEKVWLVNQINDLFEDRTRDAIIEVMFNNTSPSLAAREYNIEFFYFKRNLKKLRRHCEDSNIRRRNEWTTSRRK